MLKKKGGGVEAGRRTERGRKREGDWPLPSLFLTCKFRLYYFVFVITMKQGKYSIKYDTIKANSFHTFGEQSIITIGIKIP